VYHVIGDADKKGNLSADVYPCHQRGWQSAGRRVPEMQVGKERWLERTAPNLALDRQALPRQLPHQAASPLALQARQKITVRLNTGDK
jgi:hypothetical protein